MLPALPQVPVAVGDESRAALGEDVAPGPLRHHGHAVAKSDEEEDVDNEPREPRETAREADAADLHDGFVLPNGGHLALVHIAEGLAGLAAERGEDLPRYVFAHLDGGGGHAGQGFAGG